MLELVSNDIRGSWGMNSVRELEFDSLVNVIFII